jgi:hypothetical protein
VPLPKPTTTRFPNKPPQLFIDKISMTFGVQDAEHQKYISGQLIDLPKDHTTGWISATKGAYLYAARLHPPSGSSGKAATPWASDYVFLQAHPRNGQGGFLRIEWNPARFSPTQMANVVAQFDDYLDLPWFTFWEAKVTRLDIAVDLPGIRVGDYVFDRKQSPIRQCILRKAHLETIYLGKRARGQARVYDKQAQLGGDPSAILTRVEIAAAPNRIAEALYDLKNPFLSLQVYDLKKADLQLGAPHTRALHLALRTQGLLALDDLFPPVAAKENAKRIKASTPSFWQPEALWGHWPTALEGALPAKGMPKSCYGHFTEPGPAANAA